MSPITLSEVMTNSNNSGSMDEHWFRGGYPESLLAEDNPTASQWCDDFVTSYVERYLPQLGVFTPWLASRI